MSRKTQRDNYANMSLVEIKEEATPLLDLPDFMDKCLYEYDRKYQTNIDMDENVILNIINGKVVGVLTFSNQRSIFTVAVHPGYRRQGIAKRMVSFALKLGMKRFEGSIAPEMVNLVWAFYHEPWRLE